MTTQGDRSPGPIPELDGIRGLAIALVLWFHFGFVARAEAKALISPLTGFGWCGVDLFFVLSGFLITGILLDSRTARNYFTSFYARRALRIFPIYYLALFLWFGLAPFLSSQAAADSRHAIWYVSYLQNWGELFGHQVNWLSHTWSLAIEEQFYLVWPLVVRFLPRRRLAMATLILAVLAGFVRAGLLTATTTGWEAAYRLTPARFDALALGALGAVILREPGWMARARAWARPALGVGAIAIVILAPLTSFWSIGDPLTVTIGHSTLAWTFAWIVLLAASESGGTGLANAVLRSAALRFLGKHSYAIYLAHWPVATLLIDPPRVVQDLIRYSPPVTVVAWAVFATVGVALSIFLGFLSWHLIEKHFLLLKGRWAVNP